MEQILKPVCAPRPWKMVQKLNQGGKLTDEAAQAGLAVETASGFNRSATFARPQCGCRRRRVWHCQGMSPARRPDTAANGWIVFSRHGTSPCRRSILASDAIKKLKGQPPSGHRPMNRSPSTSPSWKSTIGTSVNETAFAQV